MKAFMDAFVTEYDEIHGRLQSEIKKYDEETALIPISENGNHATWLIGHISWCEDYLIAELPYGESFRNQKWDALFGDGSKIVANEDYPSFNDLASHYNKVHSSIRGFIPQIDLKGLSEATYEPHFYFKSKLSSILHFIEELSVHLGQLQYLQKAIAQRP